jgi:hypothetical protein
VAAVAAKRVMTTAENARTRIDGRIRFRRRSQRFARLLVDVALVREN